MHRSQQYAVYHANDLLAMLTPQASSWYEDRYRAFTHVADVVAPLEQVFALTNHIDHDWTHNPEVVWHATHAPLRSTSVGDVVLDDESGQAWLIMPIGFQELPPERRTRANKAGTPVWFPAITTYLMSIVSRAFISLRGHSNHRVTMGVSQMMRRIIQRLGDALQMLSHKTPPNDRN